MNRKLKRTTLALTTSSAVFVLLLIAGAPNQTGNPLPAIAAVEANAASTVVGDVDAPVVPRHRHSRRSRAALALPYFSFAQGLRRVTGS